MGTMRRPFVFINSAMSADGKISTIERKQVRISGTDDLKRVDQLKASADAVMVGVGTVLADNPKLTIKSEELKQTRLSQGKPKDPIRVVVDSNARTPPNAAILGSNTILASSKNAPRDKLRDLAEKSEVLIVGENTVDLIKLLWRLKERGIERLMVEGGGTLNFSLLKLGLVDEICTYIGNMVIGGVTAPTLADGEGFVDDFIKLELRETSKLGTGVLLSWKVLL
jgi:2,5-diamino-6-(ribosylamino)-4(3H)-pyrimidinone 5'-phosphate reductase